MESFLIVLSWGWRILFNLVQVIVVSYVFSRLQGRLEIILVSVLGLVYIAIRAIAFGQAQALANFAVALEKELNHIFHHLGEDIRGRQEVLAETQKVVNRLIAKGYLDMAFLTLIGLICLYNLFTTL